MDDLDEDGYPTAEALAKIEAWPAPDWQGLMDFVKGLWSYPTWGWTETVEDGPPPICRYQISTGGWSGNEDLVAALMNNSFFWLLFWQSSRRGGHYEFEVRL